MKPSGSFKTLPFLAQCIIVLFAALGFTSAIYAIWSQSIDNPTRFVVLLVVAAVSAQAKTKFYPEATISFLTFVVMVAVISESLAVSILVGVCGVTVQTVLRSKKRIPHRLVFNLGMISLTVTAAWWTHHVLSMIAQSSRSISDEMAATVLASLVYFIGNSISVALMVAITRMVRLLDLWTNHFMRSAPSFVTAGLLAFGMVGLLVSSSLPYQLLSSWSRH